MDSEDFVSSRRKIEAKEKGLRDKVVSLDKACELVNDNDTVYLGGAYYSRTPMSMVWGLIKHRKRNLTLARTIVCHEAELLAVSGTVDKIVSSWIGIGIPPTSSKLLRKYIDLKLLEFEEWGHSDLLYRLLGGMLGVPFLPSLSMIGSDLPKQLNAKDFECPFTKQKVLLVPSLFPDVAIVHGERADQYGNVQISGMKYADKEAALAASKVIVTCEQIISNNEVREAPEKTVIPYFCVDAVVEVPFGSCPHECQYSYEADYEHVQAYSKSSLEKGEDYIKEYLDQYFYSTETFLEYLEKFKLSAMIASQTRARKVI